MGEDRKRRRRRRRERIRDVSLALSTSFLGQGLVVPVSEKGEKNSPHTAIFPHTRHSYSPQERQMGTRGIPDIFALLCHVPKKKIIVDLRETRGIADFFSGLGESRV